MKAMILAAGKGTRVRPLTNELPKPMLPIINKPVIEFLLELLKKHHVEEVMINLSHLGWKIQDYVKDGYKYGLRVGYSFEGYYEGEILRTIPLGSAGGIKNIQKKWGFFDDTFIVLCGDAIIDLDISKALNFHNNHDALATIITKDVSGEKVSNYGIVVTDKNGKVISFQEKPSIEEAKSTLANTGIYIFEPGIINYIPDKGFYDIGSQLFPKLVETGERVFATTMDFNWHDIGRRGDYLRILSSALKGEIKNFNLWGKNDQPGIFKGAGAVISEKAVLKPPVYVGPSSIIGNDAYIEGPVAIGTGCEISPKCTLKNAFIMDYTKVSTHSEIHDLLLTPDYYINADGDSGKINESTLLKKIISDSRKP
ncbi:MAG: NDP-sugar synthase [Kosmotoga sp.]|nr:MAG: NDP-sugar synthase [Kosmotoga sp.]